MKCRNIINGNIVWFGSIGLNQDGTAIKANNFQESYAYNKEGLIAALIENLSVLKNELWYNTSFGIPIFDKLKSKVQLDLIVTQIITGHQNVSSISNFESNVFQNKYTCSMMINSDFGEIYLNV